MNIKRITAISVTAAIYAVVTLMIPFASYGQIQIRFSEILNLLAFINPAFAPGIILGCFIANIGSPYGVVDLIVGTSATALSMLMITRTKSLFISTLWPTFFCIFIGVQLVYLSGLPFTFATLIPVTLSVMAGEFIIMTVIGYPVFKHLMKNEKLMKILKSV